MSFPRLAFAALAAVLLFAQAPGPPALYSLMVNGQPISANGPLNLVAQPGFLIGPCQWNATAGRTDCSVSPDTAVLLSRAMDQAGVDRTLQPSGTVGNQYAADTQPPHESYHPGEVWTFIPDVACQPGSTLNVNGLGPIGLYTRGAAGAVQIQANGCLAGLPYVAIAASLGRNGMVDAFILE